MLAALHRRGDLPHACITTCLEAELSAYRALGGVANHRDQLSVLCQLRQLYTHVGGEGGGGGGGGGYREVRLSRVLTELAILLRQRHECKEEEEEEVNGERKGQGRAGEEDSLALLDKALSTIKPLVSSPCPPTLSCQAHAQAATVHLWRAVCLRERLAR